MGGLTVWPGRVRLSFTAADELLTVYDACFAVIHCEVAAEASAWLADRGSDVTAPTVDRELIQGVDPQHAWLPTHSEIDWAIRSVAVRRPSA